MGGMHAHLASDAAAFVASKGGFCMHAVTGIDRDHARAHAPGDANCPPDIARPHRAGKPIGSIISQPEGVLFAVEWNHAYHRPEYLLLCDAHAVFDVRQYSWLHVIAAFAARHGRQRSPIDQRRALLLAKRNVIERTLALSRGNERAKLGLFVKRLTDLQLSCAPGEAFDKLIVN